MNAIYDFIEDDRVFYPIAVFAGGTITLELAYAAVQVLFALHWFQYGR